MFRVLKMRVGLGIFFCTSLSLSFFSETKSISKEAASGGEDDTEIAQPRIQHILHTSYGIFFIVNH